MEVWQMSIDIYRSWMPCKSWKRADAVNVRTAKGLYDLIWFDVLETSGNCPQIPPTWGLKRVEQNTSQTCRENKQLHHPSNKSYSYSFISQNMVKPSSNLPKTSKNISLLYIYIWPAWAHLLPGAHEPPRKRRPFGPRASLRRSLRSWRSCDHLKIETQPDEPLDELYMKKTPRWMENKWT